MKVQYTMRTRTSQFMIQHRAAKLATVGVIVALSMTACTPAITPERGLSSTSAELELAQASPALAKYDESVIQQLWQREELSPRDRGLVTVAHLITSNQMAAFSSYAERALVDGVTPAELSEVVTHLAFYSGWENAMAALPQLELIFDERGIAADELPLADPVLLPLDEAAEATRATQVESDFGQVAPGVVQNTSDVLFTDLWLRPDLAPRDRSLVTVVALVSAGQVEQIPFHLGRAMDNGLTQSEAAEMLNHLAFFAGWPRVFSALPIAREVFASRG